MPQLLRGVLITLEGIDGSGKTTLARALTDLLQKHTFPVVLTKEPGGTQLGKQLRSVLQEKTVPVAPKAEYLLFASDRAQHIAELIQPSLEKKMLVISDRMGDSAIAYQGYGRGLDISMIKTINTWAMNTITPDITVYVRIDLAPALKRIAQRNEALTSFEQEKKDFFQRIIAGFDEMYKNRDNVIIVDGLLPKEDLATYALEKILSWLKHNHFLQ